MRILFVDDAERLRRSTKAGLKLRRYAVDIESDSVLAIKLFESFQYDIVILNLGLPDRQTVLRYIRDKPFYTPVLALRRAPKCESRYAHQIVELNAVADDYLVEPFNFSELDEKIGAMGSEPILLNQPEYRTG